MSIRTSTLLLTTLAGGMLASAYLIGPAPAATTAPATRESVQPVAVAKQRPAAVASSLKAARAPVPLLTRGHDTYFDVTTLAATDPAMPTLQEARATADDATTGNAAARASVERDGYRNVRGLVKSADGTWHGRAMRGATEIAVAVDASGSVSAE